MALQARLWYNRSMKMFCQSATCNSLWREHNLSERSCYENRTISMFALQLSPSFPLEWRKVMSSQNGRFTKGHVPHNKGKPMSEEQKIKLRKFKPTEEQNAKNSEWHKGRKRSPEILAKQSASLMGHSVSPETRKKISEAQKGRKKSLEAIAKASASKRGKPSNRKGAILSEETRAKLSASLTGRPGLKGYKHTQEFSQKRSEINRKQWAMRTEEEKRAHLDKLHEGARDITDSWIENAYAQLLDLQSIVYERQKRIGWYRVDFYIPSENRVIEVNGCYWHCCDTCGYTDAHPNKREKDTKRYEYLKGKGYIVEVVWEHDLPRKPYKRPK